MKAPGSTTTASLLWDHPIRDRFWTLPHTRYQHVREAGVVVFGLSALDVNVPPLGARIASTPAAVPIEQAPLVSTPPAPA